MYIIESTNCVFFIMTLYLFQGQQNYLAVTFHQTTQVKMTQQIGQFQLIIINTGYWKITAYFGCEYFVIF